MPALPSASLRASAPSGQTRTSTEQNIPHSLIHTITALFISIASSVFYFLVLPPQGATYVTLATWAFLYWITSETPPPTQTSTQQRRPPTQETTPLSALPPTEEPQPERRRPPPLPPRPHRISSHERHLQHIQHMEGRRERRDQEDAAWWKTDTHPLMHWVNEKIAKRKERKQKEREEKAAQEAAARQAAGCSSERVQSAAPSSDDKKSRCRQQ